MLMAHLPSALYAGLLLISPPAVDISSSSLNTATPPTFLVPSPSSSAARLLVEPKGGSFARMVNPQDYRNNMAFQQLSQQRALQDSRLEQCQEQQEDFEQCFFYGTGGIDRMEGYGLVGRSSSLVGARYPPNAGIGSSASSLDGSSSSSNSGSNSDSSFSFRKTKTAVPTW